MRHLLQQLLLLQLLLLQISCSEASNATAEGIKLIDWKWHELQVYAVITMFIIVTSLLKTIYHHIHFLASCVPESIVLIILGVSIGVIVFFTLPAAERSKSFWNLEPDLFFLILLPPIVLESAYSLYDRAFVDNLGSILFFAIGGTVLNFLIIGFSLFGISLAGGMGSARSNLSLNVCLLFGSIIVAVDPVAVLAIFHDIGVDHGLYYLVFGESLLNDAVTVVLYNTMNSFLVMEETSGGDIGLGVLSFFTISLGGLAIGVVFGVVSSIITRFTDSTRVVEPLVMLSLGYGSYIFSDMLGWSGLISIIACGIVQAAYAFQNVSTKSLVTLKYFTKMTASAAEAIVFLYLGVELVKNSHVWDTGFAIWALVLCLAVRFLVTFTSSWVLNRAGRKVPITFREQFIIAFGGLRGAVAFALARLISSSSLTKAGASADVKDMFVTTTLFIVMFTSLGNGMAVKPIVQLLKIRLEQRQLTSVFNEVINHTVEHVDAAIEEIAGRKGDNYFHEVFDRLDASFIRPLLQRDPVTHDERIVEIYNKVGQKLHDASAERNQKRSKTLLSNLAPSLSRHRITDTSLEAIDSEASLHAASELPSVRRRRIGERRASVSDDAIAVELVDVHKVMQQARRECLVAHSKVSKSLHSDCDVEQQMKDRRRRISRAAHILRRASSSLHRRGRHSSNIDAGPVISEQTPEFKKDENEIDGGKKIRFDLDDQEVVEEDARNGIEFPGSSASNSGCVSDGDYGETRM